LRLAPHDTYARRRLLAYLEALGRTEALIASIREWRSEAISDAGLLADAASTLMRLGQAEEGRRTFGELIERAPRDPWTLAFVGDRLRAEGLHDQAAAVYASLARMLPDEAGVTLRLALAHAGAGRLDVASRLLKRVSQTGGRNDDGRLADLAGVVEANLLAHARGAKDPEVDAEIERRLLRTPLPDAQALVLLRSPPAAQPVRLEIRRESGETLPQGAEMDAREIGLSAARIERGERGIVVLALRRDEIAGPSHPLEVTVTLLRLGPLGTLPEFQEKSVRVPADGSSLELRVEAGRLL
jgi:tetratricopeptide (TPR) repeat protein